MWEESSEIPINQPEDEVPLMPKESNQDQKPTKQKWARKYKVGDFYPLELLEKLLYAVLFYFAIILIIYIRDQPFFGGTNRTCKRNFIAAPEISRNNATYPYPNTFNKGRKLLFENYPNYNPKYAFQNIQQFGTHNSYHVKNTPGNLRFWTAWYLWLLKIWRDNFDYEFPSLTQQLDLGFRTFELDIHIREDGIMNYHVQMFDQETHCYCFGECLKDMKNWSLDHPNHGPIVTIIEPKYHVAEDSYILLHDIFLESLLEIEQEMINVIGSSNLITPDSMREPNKTLFDSVVTRGWPSVFELTDAFMFILWDQGEIREMYEAGTNGLQGRILFTAKSIGSVGQNSKADAHRIIVEGDSPTHAENLVRQAIQENHLIRTRVTSIGDIEFDQRVQDKIEAVTGWI